jgi:hypothetical protein
MNAAGASTLLVSWVLLARQRMDRWAFSHATGALTSPCCTAPSALQKIRCDCALCYLFFFLLLSSEPREARRNCCVCLCAAEIGSVRCAVMPAFGRLARAGRKMTSS